MNKETAPAIVPLRSLAFASRHRYFPSPITHHLATGQPVGGAPEAVHDRGLLLGAHQAGLVEVLDLDAAGADGDDAHGLAAHVEDDLQDQPLAGVDAEHLVEDEVAGGVDDRGGP